MRKAIFPALAAAFVTALCLPAMAASSGYVNGYIKFYQNQGNYCPTTRDCTGAKYPQSQYHTAQPIKDVKVYVQRRSDGVTLGQGTTNSSGYFNIYWYDSAASGDVLGQVIWRGEQKDGRFRLATTSDGFWIWWSHQTLKNGGTLATGNLQWGNAAAPHALSNLYDGAQKAWSNSLGQTNRMTSYFTNVNIRAFDAAACPTSCAIGPNKRIIIDSEGSAYSPQHRVMHEMGHIASYLASRDQTYRWGGNYCFGEAGPTCGWSINSAEHGAVNFEEAAATNIADVALYLPTAVAPHTCLSSVACTTGSFNLETSSGTSCGTNDNRRPINAMRYLWDNYDSRVDYTNENLNRGVWELVDTIHAFDPGFDNRQKDEPWNSTYTSIDDVDGRSCVDFRENWITWGTNSSTQLANNCGSVGD